jgi:hypothetical protein
MGLSVLSSVREQNTWLGLSLSSVSKHNMWLYYGWVCRCCRPSENTIHGWGCRCRLSVNTTCGCIMDGFVGVVVRQKTQYMVGVLVWLTDANDNPNHVFCFLTDDNTDKPIHNTTTCYVYWQTTTTTPTMYSVLWRTTTPTNPSIIQPHLVFTDRRQRQPQPCIVFSDGRQHRQTHP